MDLRTRLKLLSQIFMMSKSTERLLILPEIFVKTILRQTSSVLIVQVMSAPYIIFTADVLHHIWLIAVMKF